MNVWKEFTIIENRVEIFATPIYSRLMTRSKLEMALKALKMLMMKKRADVGTKCVKWYLLQEGYNAIGWGTVKGPVSGR